MNASKARMALVSAVAIFGLAIANCAFAAYAGNKPATSQDKSSQTQNSEHTYLGIAVAPINPLTASHLPQAIPHGQGLAIVSVEKNSPAEKAGLKSHDILLAFGDQKLFAPRQLWSLVREDKSGRDVDLNIIRAGKEMNVIVTLGAHAVAMNAQDREPVAARNLQQWIAPKMQAPKGYVSISSNPQEWETFDSMSIKKLGKDRFHVEVQYLNKKGGMDHKTFEGTREEIRKEIAAEKDLPAAERNQLSRSLDLPQEEPASLENSGETGFEQLWDHAFPQWSF